MAKISLKKTICHIFHLFQIFYSNLFPNSNFPKKDYSCPIKYIPFFSTETLMATYTFEKRVEVYSLGDSNPLQNLHSRMATYLRHLNRVSFRQGNIDTLILFTLLHLWVGGREQNGSKSRYHLGSRLIGITSMSFWRPS